MRSWVWGPNAIWLVSLRKIGGDRDVHAQRKGHEDAERRQPSVSQDRRLQEKITLSSPWSWTFSLQNWKKIHFWCSVHQSVVFCYGSLISTHLLYGKYVFHACMLSCFSRVRLFATPWTVAHQAPLSRGFSRQDHWSGLPCPPPGDLPDPGIEPVSPVAPALQAESLLLEPPETIYV